MMKNTQAAPGDTIHCIIDKMNAVTIDPDDDYTATAPNTYPVCSIVNPAFPQHALAFDTCFEAGGVAGLDQMPVIKKLFHCRYDEPGNWEAETTNVAPASGFYSTGDDEQRLTVRHMFCGRPQHYRIGADNHLCYAFEARAESGDRITDILWPLAQLKKRTKTGCKATVAFREMHPNSYRLLAAVIAAKLRDYVGQPMEPLELPMVAPDFNTRIDDVPDWLRCEQKGLLGKPTWSINAG